MIVRYRYLQLSKWTPETLTGSLRPTDPVTRCRDSRVGTAQPAQTHDCERAIDPRGRCAGTSTDLRLRPAFWQERERFSFLVDSFLAPNFASGPAVPSIDSCLMHARPPLSCVFLSCSKREGGVGRASGCANPSLLRSDRRQRRARGNLHSRPRPVRSARRYSSQPTRHTRAAGHPTVWKTKQRRHLSRADASTPISRHHASSLAITPCDWPFHML